MLIIIENGIKFASVFTVSKSLMSQSPVMKKIMKIKTFGRQRLAFFEVLALQCTKFLIMKEKRKISPPQRN